MNDINQLNPLFNNAVTNRCTVGLCDFPLLFPDAGIVPPDSWDYYIIQKTGSPFMVNGEVLLPPVFTWGSRIAKRCDGAAESRVSEQHRLRPHARTWRAA